MARTDFTSPRLCVDDGLAAGGVVRLGAEAAHYLVNVLRLERGARVLCFNGRDGNFWRRSTSRAASSRRSR